MEERKKKVLYISTFSITFFLLVFEQGVFHLCREPAREFPPMTRSCRRALTGKASQGLRTPLDLPERLPQNQNLSVLLFYDFHQLL